MWLFSPIPVNILRLSSSVSELKICRALVAKSKALSVSSYLRSPRNSVACNASSCLHNSLDNRSRCTTYSPSLRRIFKRIQVKLASWRWQAIRAYDWERSIAWRSSISVSWLLLKTSSAQSLNSGMIVKPLRRSSIRYKLHAYTNEQKEAGHITLPC